MTSSRTINISKQPQEPLGFGICGGNRIGIFVKDLNSTSEAAGMKMGDRLLSVSFFAFFLKKIGPIWLKWRQMVDKSVTGGKWLADDRSNVFITWRQEGTIIEIYAASHECSVLLSIKQAQPTIILSISDHFFCIFSLSDQFEWRFNSYIGFRNESLTFT